MSGEVHVLPPVAVIYHEEVLASGILAPAPPLPGAIADGKPQSGDVDQVFLEKKQEADKVVGLIGMYTGVMLLHDLALEAFTPGAGEVEDELNVKPRIKSLPEIPEE